MSSPKHYDAIIIGSGQGGTPLASAFAQAGHRTALIEREHIGGCCINEGCTPTKTMIASGRVAYLCRRAGDYGIKHADPDLEVSMTKVRQRKRDIVASFRGGGEKRLPAAGVEVVSGEARFTGPKELEIKLKDGSTSSLTGDKIFINAGERPARPEIPGLEELKPDSLLDSTSIQELDKIPSHLIILGGGYVGLEFGQLFRRLGSQVTIIQRADRLIPREDPDISAAILEIFKQDGITVHLSTNANRASHASPPCHVAINVKGKNSESTLQINGSHLLFAAGRTPNTDNLNLSAAGILTDSRGHITVTPQLATNIPGVYAMGDIKGGPAFTHVSYDDFRIIRDTLLQSPEKQDKRTLKTTTEGRGRLLPYVVFTDPQMGHVGLHRAEAINQFPDRKIKTAKMPMAYVARALEMDESRGLMKAVVDGDSGEILGFSCLGIEGGEIMSVMQVAMMGNVKYWELADAVFAHPTIAESLNNLWGFLE